MSATPYPNPQALFMQQYEAVRRDEVVGVLLALFLGCFGVHHFYVGRVGLGVLYCCFCWTGIPAILGVIECFLMPGRVRMYNAIQAAALAAALGIAIPGYNYMAQPVTQSGWVAPGYNPSPVPVSIPALPVAETTLVACTHCGNANPAGVHFCSGCGVRLT
jgi:TM2 domain-containing membrane protein YozV